jgi:hypothetical protein
MLRGDHRLRVFKNRMLRRLLAPKGDEMIGGWRKMHNEEILILYPSPNLIVGIATGYGLDGRGVGFRVYVGSRIYLLHVAQSGSGPAQPVGIGGRAVGA